MWQSRVGLAKYTTLRVGGEADFFAEVASEDDVVKSVKEAKKQGLEITLLGGGSNLLVADEGVAGLVMKNSLQKLTLDEKGDDILVTAGAGLSFDTLVEFAVQHNYSGLENVSFIPGTVGATPVQNVGAYGVEVGTLIEAVRFLNTETNNYEIWNQAECGFKYRHSKFKDVVGGKYIITAVTFRLQKTFTPNISYRDLAEYFSNHPAPSLMDIREAVGEIRQKKFADWPTYGTAGSFFKNPIIDSVVANDLVKIYPELPIYSAENGKKKVALGWILDRVLNLRGFRQGNVGLSAAQSLVLVNYGSATAREVDDFANMIASRVYEATKIFIEREVISVGRW